MSLPPERITIAGWLSLPPEEFIDQAYRTILRREADSSSREHFLTLLAIGALGRVELIEILCTSPEGRSQGVLVSGLKSRLRWHQLLRRIPLVGTILRRGRLMRRLPNLLQQLLSRQKLMEAQAVELQNLTAQRLTALEAGLDTVRRETRQAVEENHTLAALRFTALETGLDTTRHAVEEKQQLAALRLTALEAGLDTTRHTVEEKHQLAALQLAALEAGLDTTRHAVEEKHQLAAMRLAALEAGLDGIRLETRRAVAEYRRYLLELEPLPKAAGEPLPPRAESTAGFSASLYASFEDEFRGTPAQVRQALALYLPWVQEALLRNPALPVVDLGCGRGEWLELLAHAHISGRGVDLNPLVVASLVEQGFAVTHADLFDFLATLPAGGVAAITAFHVIEHLAPEQWLALLDEMRRVLAPGGLALLETPNPRNILVGSGDFYRDPTHRCPIFPDTLQFFGRMRGFADSTAHFFAEGRTALIPIDTWRFDTIDDYLRVSRDYAWTGEKSR